MLHSKHEIACWLHLLGVWLPLVNCMGINWGNRKLAAKFMDANRVTLTDRSWISFNVSTQDQQEYNHWEGVARNHMNVLVETMRLYPLGGNPHVVMKLHLCGK